MEPNLPEQLRALGLPQLCLIRNLQLECNLDPHLLAVSGELVAHGASPLELSRRVPDLPPYPTTPEQQALFTERYGEITREEYGERADWDDSEVYFNTSMSNFWQEPGDREVFGEAYTIALVCPVDVEAIVTYLLHVLEQIAVGPIGESDLSFLWNNYVDEMVHVDPDPDEGVELKMYNRVVERLKERLAERPDAPGKGEWDRFDEYLAK